ncbi:DUF3565 domain-containing protein [Pseudomonas sp. RIT-PI-AD]|uniref:DUF3565 domain-containing protein n=1 Tax=Pseudomonas sp. RIT-PI-AD TaxID=3035294 RepID=UPI0021D7EE07|nr:DUF3565 domain-containing protein [Pseudomonas sp. RIT-PI-AD]
METALLAAISMVQDLLQKIEEGTSLLGGDAESDPSPDGRTPALPRLTGFHRDPEGHWVAELSCGHTQHLRHQPPWQNRAWVLDPRRRDAHLGQPFACGWCAATRDAGAPNRNTFNEED